MSTLSVSTLNITGGAPIPVTAGGTGSTTAAAARTALGTVADTAANGIAVRTAANTLTARSLAAGTGISISNADGVAGNPTITCTVTAPTVPDVMTLGGIGSYQIGTCIASSNVADGGTTAGSNIRVGRHNSQGSNFVPPLGQWWQSNNASWNGGGTAALSGTWRKMSYGTSYAAIADGYGNTVYYWYAHLWVRIA